MTGEPEPDKVQTEPENGVLREPESASIAINAERGASVPVFSTGPGLRQAIREHAAEAYAKQPPEECCGFVATDGKRQRVFRSPNLAADPSRDFATCENVWRAVEDSGWEVIAGYHSHVNMPPVPSPADKTVSERFKMPYVIVGWPTDAWDVYMPSGWRAELLGRPFVHGILDCYTLARDYFDMKCGIALPNYDREDSWWFPLVETEDGRRVRTDGPGRVIGPPLDLYMEKFSEAGFIAVDDPRMHDALIIQTARSPVANHCAVYLGDGLIMHHVQDRVSAIEPYVAHRGNYARGTRLIVRHSSLI